MRRALILAVDNEPLIASRVIDVAERIPARYRNTNPLHASLSYWIHTPYTRVDPEEPGGGAEVVLRWLDPIGKVRQSLGEGVDLNDGDSIRSQFAQVNRQSGTSLLTLTITAINQGSATLSYRLLLAPNVDSDCIYLHAP